jgi:hypothetical protein
MQIPNSFVNPNLLTNVGTLNLLSHPTTLSFPVNLPVPVNMFNMNFPFTFSPPLPNPGVSDSANANFYNMMLMWKFQNDFQGQLLKPQFFNVQEIQDNPSHISTTNSSTSEHEPFQNLPLNETFPSNQFLPELCDPNKSVKAHLKDIMYFVLDNVGTLSDEKFKIEKLKYRNHKELMMVFEALVSKYITAVKTKEEMVKYTFRKALKFMKLKIKKEMKKGGATEKRHFKTFLEEMSGKIEEDADDNENFAKAILPFKQNSKVNHISAEVIAEAFSSEEFSQGFQEYLRNLDSTIELDNNKKIDKFIRLLKGQ